jgi:hypothetical protein
VSLIKILKQSDPFDKQDQQGKAAFNERNPHMTQQQKPVARSLADPKQKQDRAQVSTDRFITK